jgi:hypothetical protein
MEKVAVGREWFSCRYFQLPLHRTKNFSHLTTPRTTTTLLLGSVQITQLLPRQGEKRPSSTMGDSGATDPPREEAELSIVVEFSYVLSLTHLLLCTGCNSIKISTLRSPRVLRHTLSPLCTALTIG